MPTSRRAFLQVGAGAAAAVLLQPLLGRGRALSAGPPPAVKVLVEDVRLDPSALARGSLVGLRASASGLALAPGRSAGRYTSQVLMATTRFTHIGVHWLADDALPDVLSFEVRWSADGGGWSEWEDVAIEAHAPDAAAPRTFGALVAADRANRIQFRVAFAAATGASPLLRETTLTLLNAKDGPRIALAAPLESATTTLQLTGGALYSREQWGAEESLRFSDGAEIWPRMYVPTKKLVVHHTATTNNYGSVDDAMAEVRAIYTYHAVTLGWGDIGYTAVIDKLGNVYEGRHGRGSGSSREILSPDVVAGHALSHNYGTTGAALLGTFTKRGEGGKPGDPPPPEMTQSLVDLLVWDCERHDVYPEGASDFLRFDDGWNRGLANVPGHRDCNATICPGGHIYDLLPWLRSEVATALGRTAPSVILTPPGEDTVPLSAVRDLTYAWQGDESTVEFSYLLEGWRRRAPLSEDLDYLAGFDDERFPAWATPTLTSVTFGELFDTFGPGELRAGHYTMHVRAVDGSGNSSYQSDHTLLVTDDAGNAAPTAMITAPTDGSTFASGAEILFEGAASDPEDGDLTASLIWTSDLDGQIGTGGSFTAVLNDGTHLVTASAADSAGATASDQVSVAVGVGTGVPIALTAAGYRVKGLQKADLEWSGATSAQVDILRDGAPLVTTDNEGFYTDHIDQRGGGSYTYQVCEAGTTTCSNEATVTF